MTFKNTLSGAPVMGFSHCQGTFSLKTILCACALQIQFISFSFSHLISFCSRNSKITVWFVIHCAA